MSDQDQTTPESPVAANATAVSSAPRSTLDLRTEYFKTLRSEILEVKARLTRLTVIGLIGVPIMTYFAVQSDANINFLLLLSPLVTMLLVVLYFSEQSSMMRAGSYIHAQLESHEGDWEHWINDLRNKRSEPQLFGLILIVSMAYSMIMGSMAIESIMEIDFSYLSNYIYYLLKYVVPVVYALTFIWIVGTILMFWRSAFRAD